MTSKKGQAAAAAALLAIIAGLITLYILFVPPEERERILGTDGDGTTSISRSEKNVTLLKEAPGRIDFLSQKKIEHVIPNLNIFTRTAGIALERRDSLRAERSLFSSVEAEMEFSLSDIANTENVLLSFTTKSARGAITISLNEQDVFANEVPVGGSLPVSLPQKLLREHNQLHFTVSSPGAAFWRRNGYVLEDVQVTGDVTKTDAQYSKNLFIVSPTEFHGLDKAKLRFQPDCDEGKVSPLDIRINEYALYSSVPECGVGRLNIEFAPSYLRVGENSLTFNVERGSYIVSHISVDSELKQADFPTFFFELSEERYNKVQNATKKAVVRLDFVDADERKQGVLLVNGRTEGFDARGSSLEIDISRDVVRGNNGIKIRPDKTLDVRELRVLLANR